VEPPATELDPHPTVLVVDDERGPRLALQLILQRQFRVLTAESGEEALEILRAEPVDAVTLDLKMPGLAGQNTLSLIRGIDPTLPVVIITGYGSYESAVNALKLRAFDYVSKPFDSKRILMVIHHAVAERRRAKAQDPATFIGPLDAVIEAADWLERSGSEWLSNPDRAALDCIRTNVRAVQEQCRPQTVDDGETYDLFHPQKGHG
jgi:DNA-binding response OmpR family regulator